MLPHNLKEPDGPLVVKFNINQRQFGQHNNEPKSKKFIVAPKTWKLFTIRALLQDPLFQIQSIYIYMCSVTSLLLKTICSHLIYGYLCIT